jgi:hypothetical protein
MCAVTPCRKRVAVTLHQKQKAVNIKMLSLTNFLLSTFQLIILAFRFSKKFFDFLSYSC